MVDTQLQLGNFDLKTYNQQLFERGRDCRTNKTAECCDCKYIKGEIEYKDEYVITHSCRLDEPWKCLNNHKKDKYKHQPIYWKRLQQN